MSIQSEGDTKGDAVQPEGSLAEPALLPESAATEPLGGPYPTKTLSGLEPSGPSMTPIPEQPIVPPRIEPDEPGWGSTTQLDGGPNPLRDKSASPKDPGAPVEPDPQVEPVEPAKPATGDAEKGVMPGKRGDPFDPIAVNGPIFVGWPKPKLALVLTGRQEGYMEPCGCAGLDRMKGGMSRRHTMFQDLRKKGWPVVAVDVGGIAKGFGRQAELKFQIMVEGMRKMGYDAITLGKSDLRLPAMELLSVTANTDANKSPFVSANVVVFDPAMTAKAWVIEEGDMKIGVTGVLGKQSQKAINNPGLKLVDPETALKQIVPKLKQKCNLLILLAHASMEETLDLARKFPDFDLVVTAGGAPVPPNSWVDIKGSESKLIEVGEKGMDAVVLGLYDDAKKPVRYQRVPLDSRFKNSSDMRLLMEQYQDQLKHLGFGGLGIRPVSHPQEETLGKFVGSDKCKSCHEESYKVWKKSGHAKAYQTLEEVAPPRNFDPECVSCHVVGWHPTKFFPYEGGYQSKEKTPQLINTGCETCHGPGGEHVKAETGGDTALQEKLRQAVVLTKEEAKKGQCVTCHDLDNSPDFKFDLYWPHVEHHEDE